MRFFTISDAIDRIGRKFIRLKVKQQDLVAWLEGSHRHKTTNIILKTI